MKVEKKAVRSGYDMDIIPSDLNTYGGEAKRLLEDLQSRNERMFLVTVVFLNTAKNKQELENGRLFVKTFLFAYIISFYKSTALDFHHPSHMYIRE